MWLSFMAHMCIMIIPLGNFFNFSKFWYYKSSRGVARTENGLKMTIKFCLLYLIFQELYIIWSSFIVHMCKRIVSSGISFFFVFIKYLVFRIIMGVKGKKILSVSLRISGTVYHMIVIFGIHVQKDDISSNKFQFF